MPKWIIINNQGTTAGGARLFTYSNLNRTQFKPVYQDPAGTIPYTNPIVFNANGTEGPFYFKSDSDNPDDTYFLVAQDSNGNQLWTIENFFPSSGSGGGSSTTYTQLNNLIANNVFIDHVDSDFISNLTPLPLYYQLAPGNHHGFTPFTINPVIGNFGAVGTDTLFVKDNTNATDQITFVRFTSNALANNTTDTTPQEYIRYQCTDSDNSENYKCFQFPICKDVRNLSNQTVTFTVWAKVTTTAVDLTLFYRQYFGSGSGASSESRNSVGTINLTSSWNKFIINFVLPSIDSATIGACGDDALYIQLGMPLNAICDVQFTKPSLYVGEINPQNTFDTYDQIDAIIQTPRTSEYKFNNINSIASSGVGMKGWVPCVGSIGSPGSSATTRKNLDTFPLYKILWDNISDQFAPVSTGRGASAVSDFSANKFISLTKSLGRILAGLNPNSLQSQVVSSVNIIDSKISFADASTYDTAQPVYFTSTVTLPAPLIAYTVYYVIQSSATEIKLAESVDFAQSNTPITITTTGSGTITMFSASGAITGEGLHQLTIAESASHNHPPVPSNTMGNSNAQGTSANIYAKGVNEGTFGHLTIPSQGGDEPHNTVQPTIFSNLYIKL
jgi:hypothetical protein